MNISQFNILLNINHFHLINRFNFRNFFELPKVDKLKLSLNISSNLENNVLFSYANFLLENFGMQKSSISKYGKTLKGKDNYEIFFSTQLTLRKCFYINFFYFLMYFCFNNMKYEIYKVGKNINSNRNYCKLKIYDISVIPEFNEIFTHWKYPILIYVFFPYRKSNIIFIKTLLKNFGFIPI